MFPGHAKKGPISAAVTGTGNSSVFRHGLPRTRCRTFWRNAASGCESGSYPRKTAAEFEPFTARRWGAHSRATCGPASAQARRHLPSRPAADDQNHPSASDSTPPYIGAASGSWTWFFLSRHVLFLVPLFAVAFDPGRIVTKTRKSSSAPDAAVRLSDAWFYSTALDAVGFPMPQLHNIVNFDLFLHFFQPRLTIQFPHVTYDSHPVFSIWRNPQNP